MRASTPALIFTLHFLPALAAAAVADLPNIIFVLADDLGLGDVSSYNPQSKIQTPHIDHLAAGGMCFTDAHTASSLCTRPVMVC